MPTHTHTHTHRVSGRKSERKQDIEMLYKSQHIDKCQNKAYMCLEATLLREESLSHIVTIATSWGSFLPLSLILCAATWERLRKFGETLWDWAPWFMCGTSVGSVQWLDTSIYMLSFFLPKLCPQPQSVTVCLPPLSPHLCLRMFIALL